MEKIQSAWRLPCFRHPFLVLKENSYVARFFICEKIYIDCFRGISSERSAYFSGPPVRLTMLSSIKTEMNRLLTRLLSI